MYKDKDDRSAELAAITALERECLSEASHIRLSALFLKEEKKTCKFKGCLPVLQSS